MPESRHAFSGSVKKILDSVYTVFRGLGVLGCGMDVPVETNGHVTAVTILNCIALAIIQHLDRPLITEYFGK